MISLEQNPFAALFEEMRPETVQHAAFCLVQVQSITDSIDGKGYPLTASFGELPLEAQDLIFCEHTKLRVAVGTWLLCLPDAEKQFFYCIGIL